MTFDPKLITPPANNQRLRDKTDEGRAADIQALITHNIETFGMDDEDDFGE